VLSEPISFGDINVQNEVGASLQSLTIHEQRAEARYNPSPPHAVLLFEKDACIQILGDCTGVTAMDAYRRGVPLLAKCNRKYNNGLNDGRSLEELCSIGDRISTERHFITEHRRFFMFGRVTGMEGEADYLNITDDIDHERIAFLKRKADSTARSNGSMSYEEVLLVPEFFSIYDWRTEELLERRIKVRKLRTLLSVNTVGRDIYNAVMANGRYNCREVSDTEHGFAIRFGLDEDDGGRVIENASERIEEIKRECKEYGKAKCKRNLVSS
jgi:hypothetical protein